MPAPALEALRVERLSELRSLVGLRPGPADRALSRRSATAESGAAAINRAIAVVASAHLEGFVEDLVVDLVDELNRHKPASARLSPLLLAAHVDSEIAAIGEMTQADKRASRIADMFRDHAALWLEDQIPQGGLSAKPLVANLGNPGAREVERIFATFGMTKVFDAVELADDDDAVRRVNELVGIRNAIAHGDSAQVDDDKADRFVDLLEALGEGLTATAASFVQHACGLPTLPW